MVGRFLRVFGMALLLAGCGGQSGPVFGEWQGRQPTGDEISPSFVTLVLHGSPTDIAGEYDIQAVMQRPGFESGGSHDLTWGDRWTLTRLADPDAAPILVLHNLPNSQISRYALMSNGILLPATRANLPDTSPGSLRYGLTPVAKDSFAYGRL